MANWESGRRLRSQLRELGLSNAAIEAAWPRWWSDDANSSLSAQAELRFSVARRLGLDPRSLLDDRDAPRFLWQEEARFKHLSGEDDLEQAGITSFGKAVASILVAASPEGAGGIAGAASSDLRELILRSGRPYVDLVDLLSLAWSSGVPVGHLRIFPWPQKRMAAMTVGVKDRWVVLLGKDARYPAPISFYLAHELGHIALGHLSADRVIVDLEEVQGSSMDIDDVEERAADEFAMALLTGEPHPVVLPAVSGAASPRELARVALAAAEELQIEPGTLAQSFGYSTGDWATATGSLRYIYSKPAPVWGHVNRIARRQLSFEALPPDAAEFLETVLGQTTAA
jgi:hypothetical protein